MVITNYLVKSVLRTYGRQIRQRSMQPDQAGAECSDDQAALGGKATIPDAVRGRMVMERMTSQALERAYPKKDAPEQGVRPGNVAGCEVANGREDLLDVEFVEDGLKGVRMAVKKDLNHPEYASKEHKDKANGRAHAVVDSTHGKKDTSPGKRQAGDGVFINIEGLTRELMETEEIRASKVDYLRELIRRNAYVIHANEVAQRMLEEIW